MILTVVNTFLTLVTDLLIIPQNVVQEKQEEKERRRPRKRKVIKTEISLEDEQEEQEHRRRSYSETENSSQSFTTPLLSGKISLSLFMCMSLS